MSGRGRGLGAGGHLCASANAPTLEFLCGRVIMVLLLPPLPTYIPCPTLSSPLLYVLDPVTRTCCTLLCHPVLPCHILCLSFTLPCFVLSSPCFVLLFFFLGFPWFCPTHPIIFLPFPLPYCYPSLTHCPATRLPHLYPALHCPKTSAT